MQKKLFRTIVPDGGFLINCLHCSAENEPKIRDNSLLPLFLWTINLCRFILISKQSNLSPFLKGPSRERRLQNR